MGTSGQILREIKKLVGLKLERSRNAMPELRGSSFRFRIGRRVRREHEEERTRKWFCEGEDQFPQLVSRGSLKSTSAGENEGEGGKEMASPAIKKVRLGDIWRKKSFPDP